MAKEIIREIRGHRYKYLVYWDKETKKAKQKYLGRVEREKTISIKNPDEKNVAEAILRIGGGLIERKQLEKWIKRLKVKENMEMLRQLFINESHSNKN